MNVLPAKNPSASSHRQCGKGKGDSRFRTPDEDEKTGGNPFLARAREAARLYCRRRHLPPLLALWPHELEDFSAKGTRRIIGRLEKSLQAERRRGRSRHWAYDINRHIALLSALEGERLWLQKTGGGRGYSTSDFSD